MIQLGDPVISVAEVMPFHILFLRNHDLEHDRLHRRILESYILDLPQVILTSFFSVLSWVSWVIICH